MFEGVIWLSDFWVDGFRCALRYYTLAILQLIKVHSWKNGYEVPKPKIEDLTQNILLQNSTETYPGIKAKNKIPVIKNNSFYIHGQYFNAS